MKNPNGYGSVVKLSGNRRRPYAVRKTLGINEKGYPIYICLAYTATREEGLLILAEYNKDAYNLEDINITVKQLYERFFSSIGAKMSYSLQGSLRSAWKHCTSVYDMKYRMLKSYHIQECIDNCTLSSSSQAAIKNLFRHLDRFASELDIITRQRSLNVKAPAIPETTRQPFTDDETAVLWDNRSIPWVDTVLILIYSGMRISELLGIRKEDVDLDNNTIKCGVKTQAGKNRLIPIHPRILPFVKNRFDGANEYLFTKKGNRLTKSKYYTEWKKLMTHFEMTHTPHECRHTFRSRMDSAGANKRCIDLIMGHKSKDVGERVYTHKTIEELTAAVSLLE